MSQFFKPHYVLRPAQALRRVLQALQGDRPGPRLVRLPWSLQMRVDPSEAIGRAIWQLGLYDLVVSETLWRLIAPGDLVFDVGANIGSMTGLMALRAGPAGEVRAYEPHPGVFADLQQNVLLFRRHPDLAPIRSYPMALSETQGQAALYCGDDFTRNRGLASLHATTGPSLLVSTTTLDEALGPESASLVKMDVEGGEHTVLKGAGKALREGRIAHLIYEATPESKQALADLLTQHGYTLYALGWRFSGPLLTDADSAPDLPGYEAPNYLATLDPTAVTSRLRPRGWRVLQS